VKRVISTAIFLNNVKNELQNCALAESTLKRFNNCPGRRKTVPGFSQPELNKQFHQQEKCQQRNKETKTLQFY